MALDEADDSNEPTVLIANILSDKNRDSVYNIGSSDFERILKQQNESIFGKDGEHRDRKRSEDLIDDEDEDEFFDVVGEVDPKLVMQINQNFEAGLLAAEADSFWCFSKLLDGVLDYFTDMQPGVQMTIANMENLVSYVDKELCQHF